MKNILKLLYSYKRTGEGRIIKVLGIKFPPLKEKIKFSKIKNPDLKIAFYVGCNDNISSRYRVDNIVKGLAKKNIASDIYYKSNLKALENKTKYNLLVVFRSGEFDKKYINQVENMILNFKAKNIPVIYDIDDLLIKSGNENGESVEKLCKLASAITVTTNKLADFYREINPNTYVIKNTINFEQYSLAQKLNKNKNYKNKTVKIVYQCGSKWHNRDFLVCQDALIQILEKYKNAEFHLIGPVSYDKKFKTFGKRFVRPKYMNYKDLLIYVSKMDINIAPLVIDDFNNCKSELKIFESALVKVPTVASPTTSYKELINNWQNGFLANDTNEWVNCLSDLIEDINLRQNMSEKAFEEFVPMFYIENEIKNVIEIYNKIKQ